jgi:Flp pilus assembly protein TadG
MKSKLPVTRMRKQRGNSIVEGALVFLPLFALIFGIADFSMALFITGAFQEAARDAARYLTSYSLTYNGTTYGSQTAVAKAIMYAETFGFINATNDAANNYVQVNYYFPNDLSTPATCVSACDYTWTDSNGNTYTINYENAPGDVVEVHVANYPWNWMAPLPGIMPGKSINLTADAVDILQGLPSGTTTPPAP